MGTTDIYYCQTCGVRVPPADVISGAALVIVGQNRMFCKDCTPKNVHDAPTETDLRPLDPSRDLLDVIPVAKNERRSSRSLIPAQRSSDNPRPAAPQSKAPLIAMVAAGVMIVAAGAIFFFSSRQSPPTKTVSTNTGTDTSAETLKKTDPLRTPANPAFTVNRPWGPVCVLAYDNPEDAPEQKSAWIETLAVARFTPWKPAPEALPVPYIWGDSPTEVVVSTPEVAPRPVNPNEVVLAKIDVAGISGGRLIKDITKKGADGRTIYGQKTPETAMAARFDMKLPTNGPATVVLNTVRLNTQPCAYAVGVNGHEIFKGSETGKEREWVVQSIPVPAGIVQGGRNEVRIVNLDPSGNYGSPQIVVGSIEIRGNPPAAPTIVPVKPIQPAVTDPALATEPAFPPILDAQQRAELQLIDTVFTSLSKYELDTPLRLAQTDTSASGKQLTALLTQAQTVFTKAIAAVNKSSVPLMVKASAGNLNVSGQVIRIEGGKAWVKDRGLEVSVDLSALPPEIFFKALASNDTTPDGRVEKAMLAIAVGNVPSATALLRKAGAHPASAEMLALLNRYAQLSQLQKFETEVNEVAAAIRDKQTQDAATKIKALQQTYPELARLHKERLAYWLSKAETKR